MKKETKLKHYILYTYILSNQPESIRVRFVYLLKGRGQDQGIVQQFKGKFLVPGCFMLPIKKDKEMQEIFQKWKIKYKKIQMLTY